MTIRKILVCLFVLPVLGLLSSAQQVEIKKVPIKNVDSSSGKDMYLNYCGACHGRDGTGNGPAAPALKTAPTDLTTLSRTHGGTFPESHVYTVISGDSAMPAAHGEENMPVWGALFRSLHSGIAQPAEVHQRISNLTKYLQSIQVN